LVASSQARAAWTASEDAGQDEDVALGEGLVARADERLARGALEGDDGRAREAAEVEALERPSDARLRFLRRTGSHSAR
jgi:hypothetical protein